MSEYTLNEGLEYIAVTTREALVDLLTDLRHWCGREGVNFPDAYAQSLSHFNEEIKAT